MKSLLTLILLFISSTAHAICTDFIGTNISDQGIGLYSHAQLFNPLNSGKNLELSRIDIAVTVWGQTPPGTRGLDFVIQSAPLANVSGNMSCKNIGDSTIPAAQMFQASLPASMVTGVKPVYEFWVGVAENDHPYIFSTPLIIPPGKGVSIRGGQTAMYVVTSWQWHETSLTP